MLITLDIEPEIANAYTELGKQTKRSRKAFMEMILSDHIKKIHQINIDLNGDKTESKTDKHLPSTKKDLKEIGKLFSSPKIKDLNKEQVGEKPYNPMDNPRFREKNKIK